MPNATNTPAVSEIVIVRNEKAGQLLLDAGKAYASVLDLTRDAAKLAVEGFNPMGLKLAEQVEKVAALYAEDFAKVDHNVKAIFKDCVTLLLAPNEAVSLERKIDGVKTEVHTTADKAVDMAKHTLREAAKQVREANGMGRQGAGGRKPSTPTTAPVQVTDDGEAAFAAWLSNLPVYWNDGKRAKRIVDGFKELGIKLQIDKTSTK